MDIENVEQLLTSPYADDEKMEAMHTVNPMSTPMSIRMDAPTNTLRFVNNPLRPGDTAEAGVPDSLAPLRELKEILKAKKEGNSIASIIKRRYSKTPKPDKHKDQEVQCNLYEELEQAFLEEEEEMFMQRYEEDSIVPDEIPILSRANTLTSQSSRVSVMMSEEPVLERRVSMRQLDRRPSFRQVLSHAEASAVAEEDEDETEEEAFAKQQAMLKLENPRKFFVAQLELRLESEDSFDSATDRVCATMFVALFKRLQRASINRTKYVRTIPRVCVVLILVTSFVFSTLISEYSTEAKTVSSTLDWFVPHFVSGGQRTMPSNVMVRWGGASRCIIVEHKAFWRLFTCPFVHVSSNQFCANIIGLFVWGLHFESRYGCIRFGIVTFVSVYGGILLALVWLESTTCIAGVDGAVAAHANMFLLDMLLNSKEKATTKVFFGCITLGFVMYSILTNARNTLTMYIGGVAPSFFFCYLYQSHYATDKTEVCIFILSFSIFLAFLIVVPFLVFWMPLGPTCVS